MRGSILVAAVVSVCPSDEWSPRLNVLPQALVVGSHAVYRGCKASPSSFSPSAPCPSGGLWWFLVWSSNLSNSQGEHILHPGSSYELGVQKRSRQTYSPGLWEFIIWIDSGLRNVHVGKQLKDSKCLAFRKNWQLITPLVCSCLVATIRLSDSLWPYGL